eukprot:gnl/TRDRNA2_/TRDRNA2_182341_c0_seq1.p1 gnl/TRDRNA2_/TRDRNA2_182341_c0~~gnl/TRDRNA2_/TRDRNA2_182341_c0_seq1.p1  ORF type:complete len:177 (+),score=39.37 gnl/TRDRNA2_/TRDRNA2_182341_c0_seq1:108-638(+)
MSCSMQSLTSKRRMSKRKQQLKLSLKVFLDVFDDGVVEQQASGWNMCNVGSAGNDQSEDQLVMDTLHLSPRSPHAASNSYASSKCDVQLASSQCREHSGDGKVASQGDGFNEVSYRCHIMYLEDLDPAAADYVKRSPGYLEVHVDKPGRSQVLHCCGGMAPVGLGGCSLKPPPSRR